MDLGAPETPRWVQRFQNFDGALLLLREGVELLAGDVHPIVQEGVIQRFEFTFELAWKTLKDYLVWRKVTLERTGPADVIRAAYGTRYVNNGEIWMEALDARNEMSHTYRRQAFERVVGDISSRFLACFEELHEMLVLERLKLASA